MLRDVKPPARNAETKENLQERYKPLGLKAVVAASQHKPEKKAATDNRERHIPAVLQAEYD